MCSMKMLQDYKEIISCENNREEEEEVSGCFLKVMEFEPQICKSGLSNAIQSENTKSCPQAKTSNAAYFRRSTQLLLEELI